MENPLSQLLNSSQTVESFMEWHKEIPITPEQRRDWEQSHSQCHGCGHWKKDTDFSSFTLGMVLCTGCDR